MAVTDLSDTVSIQVAYTSAVNKRPKCVLASEKLHITSAAEIQYILPGTHQ